MVATAHSVAREHVGLSSFERRVPAHQQGRCIVTKRASVVVDHGMGESAQDFGRRQARGFGSFEELDQPLQPEVDSLGCAGLNDPVGVEETLRPRVAVAGPAASGGR